MDISIAVKEILARNPIHKRLARGISWVTVGSIARQAATFLGSILAARLLGVSGFGKLMVIQTTVLMLASIGQAGIGISAAKYIAHYRVDSRQNIGRLIGFTLQFISISGLLISIVLAIFSVDVSHLLLPRENIGPELQVAGLWVVFEMLNQLQVKILNGLESFRMNAGYNIIQAVLIMPGVVMGAYLGGVFGAISGLAIANTAGFITGHFILRRECRRQNINIILKGSWKEKKILKMSVMVWLSGIAMYTINWLMGILVARNSGGFGEYGLFAAAERFKNMLLFLPTMIFQVTIPVLSNIHAEGNRRAFRKALLSMEVIGVGLTLIGALLLSLLPGLFMSVFGDDFDGGALVLIIVAWGSVAAAAWTISTAALWAVELSKKMLLLDFLRGGLLLLLALSGMAVSAEKLAYAYLMSYLFSLLPLMFVLNRFLRKEW